MFAGFAAIFYLIAIVVVVAGGIVSADGYEKLPSERGMTEFVSGLGLVTGGALLMGVASVILCLGKLHRAFLENRSITPRRHEAAIPAITELGGQPSDPPVVQDIPVKPNVIADVDAVDDQKETMPLMIIKSGDEDLAPVTARPLAVETLTEQVLTEEPVERQDGAFDSDPPPMMLPEQVVEEGRGRETEHGFYASPSAATDANDWGISPSNSHNEHELPRDNDLSATNVAAPENNEAVDVLAIENGDSAPKDSTPTIEERNNATSSAKIVGNYESGGNRYVMYSDGSIEVHLPLGIRRFQSLDELKKFIASNNSA